MKNWITVLWLCGAWASAGDAASPFSGNTAFKDQRITSHLSQKGLETSKSDEWTPVQRRRALRIVRQLYQDNGYPLARVQAEQAGPRFRFRIDEGPLAYLGWTQFEGNASLSDQRLESFFPIGDKMNLNDVEAALEEVRRTYRNSGFPRVQVKRRALQLQEAQIVEYFPIPFRRVPRNLVRLRFEIDEGPLFTFGTFEVPVELRTTDVEPPSAGDLYSEERLVEYHNRIRRSLFARGRLIKKLDISQRFDEQAQRIDVRVDLHLYPPLEVRWIEFDGNHRYADTFYRRELALAEGRLFDPRLVNLSLESLNATGVLSRPLVEDDVRVTVRGENVDVTFKIEEKKPRGFFYTLTRSDLGGIQARLVFTVANLLGLSEELGLEVDVGGGVSGVAISWASRYFLGTDLPLSLGLRAFRRHSRVRLAGVEDRLQDIFVSREIGVSGLAAYRISRRQQAGAAYTARRFTRPDRTSNLVLAPFWQRRFGPATDRRNLRLTNRFSFFGGTAQSWNWRPGMEFRRELQEESEAPKFTFRLRADYARFSSGEQILSERLFSDSDDIRGFSPTTSGPWGVQGDRFRPLGGDAFLAVNTEYEMPLNSTFSFAPFVDGGFNMATSTPPGLTLTRETNRIWRASVGAELRIDLPGALPTARLVAAWNPLRLDKRLMTPSGLARLADPKAMFRLAFDPVF